MFSSDSGGRDALIQVSEIESGVVTITINRPTALNALTRPMMVDLAKTFTRLGKDAAVKAIILTGAGRAFCAGVVSLVTWRNVTWHADYAHCQLEFIIFEQCHTFDISASQVSQEANTSLPP